MPSVLRHRHFRNVWFAAFGSSVGTFMEMVGVQWVMAEHAVAHGGTGAESPAALMAYLTVAQLGPVLVLGLFGGLVADRADRRRLLIVTQAMMMVIAALLALASGVHRLTPAALITLGFINGCVAAFNIPAWQVLAPRLVPRDELQKAVTLNGVQFNLARVVGPAIGGALLAAGGPTGLFIINTLSFLGVIVAVAATPGEIGKRKAENGNHEPGAPAAFSLSTLRASLWNPLREALAFTFLRPGPRALFVALMLYSSLAVPVIRFLPLFTTQVYHKREDTFGLLLSLLGAGAVVGGLLTRLVPRWYPKHHLIPLSITAGALFMALFAAAPTLALAAPMMALAGVFWLLTFTTSLGAIQLLAPDEMRGRVLSICNTATFGAVPLGSLLTSVVGELAARAAAPHASATARAGLAVQWGVGLCAAGLFLAGLVTLIWRTPEIDGLERTAPGNERKPGLLRGLTASAHRPASSPPTPAMPLPAHPGQPM